MTRRQITITVGLLLVALVISSVLVGLDLLWRQNIDPRNLHSDHLMGEAQAKEMWATATAMANESSAAMAVTATATPDATATLAYIYTHMDEFVKPARTPTPTQGQAAP